MADNEINVEVAYALPHKQQIIRLKVPADCSVLDAVVRSGISDQFPEIDLETAKLGIFGKAVAKPRQQQLKDGDRVEIYRPLIADPKEVRKARAAKVKAEKAKAK